ncbi:HK97 gp10 family phage protein [Anaerosolibacter sp.]|uniref:HK97 gp10 family phage protein n=1 Tax=Anaerosolibacter sp. TaxID=1872527 RepID=UPI0039EFF4BB
MANISIDQLADEITKAVREYTEDVSRAIERKVDNVAKEVLMDTAMNAPHDTGEYARTFKITKQDEYGKTRRIIWNKKHYRRVHLLEFGHAKVKGGRVPAFPHLRPAYDKYGVQLPDDIARIIRNGGGE